MLENVINSSEDSFIKLMNPAHMLGRLYASRELAFQLAKRAIRSRYKGTVLGVLWTFIMPLAMLAIYTFVFGVVFKGRWDIPNEKSAYSFPLVLFCGLIIYNIFSETITSAVTSIERNKNYVKKVVFPLEILPLVSLYTALFFALIWLLVMVVGIVIFMQYSVMSLLTIPVLLLPYMFCIIGIAWFVASLGVYFKDIKHSIDIILRILLYASAVFYPLSRLPETYQKILLINPIAIVIDRVRATVFFNTSPSALEWGIWMLCSLVICQLGYIWFMKTKKGFADVM